MAYTPALILLSLVKVRLSLLLTLCHLAIWLDGSVPFRFGKGGSGILANCSRCSTKATLSFSPGLVCSSFSAEACAFLQALCWSWYHQQVCHFSSLLLSSYSRSSCHSVLFSAFFFTSNSLADLAGSAFGRSGERYSCPLQSLVIAFFLPFVSTLVFSLTGGVLSCLNSLTYSFPRFALRNLCSLVMLAVSFLVFAAADTTYCLALFS